MCSTLQSAVGEDASDENSWLAEELCVKLICEHEQVGINNH